MRVYIAMLLLIFSGLVFSDPNDIIPEIKELTKLQREKYGKLSGGSSVILNSKNYERQEFEMYLNLVLTKSEIDLKNYCISYLNKSNFSEKYFDSFLESVFG